MSANRALILTFDFLISLLLLNLLLVFVYNFLKCALIDFIVVSQRGVDPFFASKNPARRIESGVIIWLTASAVPMELTVAFRRGSEY